MNTIDRRKEIALCLLELAARGIFILLKASFWLLMMLTAALFQTAHAFTTLALWLLLFAFLLWLAGML